MKLRRTGTAVVLALAVSLTTAADLPASNVGNPIDSGNGTVVAHVPFEGAGEIDFDGRYAYVGQFNGKYDRQNVAAGQEGGLRVIDLVGGPTGEGEDTSELFEQVGYLNCPGTDNYVRWMDPAVFGGDYVVMAFHGNECTKTDLRRDPNTAPGYGASNGIAIVDVSDRANPVIVDQIGHWSAHTVMPHPTRPYIYILPGGLITNGTTAGQRISPTGIIDASDPTDLKYVASYEHNISGCHDLGFSADGDFAYCAGIVEVQVWDIAGDNIESPVVVNTITNPAIQFPHNAVISPDGTKLLINDEAFGFHTCEGQAADLYGSLWIYDITIPNLPILAGRISPPAMPGNVGNYTGWVQSWCAAHNYNFVPGTDIVVASWFAGGMTAHDISDPLNPELVAAYQPGGESVMWSAHYYGGYVLTGDMGVGVEILDIPALREAEEAAAGADPAVLASRQLAASAPRIDRTAELVPAVLPPRPARPAFTDAEGGFCVIPGVGR